jgi:hypothetical protein
MSRRCLRPRHTYGISFQKQTETPALRRMRDLCTRRYLRHVRREFEFPFCKLYPELYPSVFRGFSGESKWLVKSQD